MADKAAETAMQVNYVTANRFYIFFEASKEPTASFSECAGLGVNIKYNVLVEGGVNDQRRVVLDEPEFSPVTLKRGITDSLMFWEWLQTLLDDSKAKKRRNVSILLFNQAGEKMQCWTLIGAIPVGWKVDSLQASSEAVALEELTLVYEGLRIEGKGKGPSNFEHANGRHQETAYFTGQS
ncbi:MAG: phage tail protein [Leptolyngbya sp. SIO4C5]|nr:phage tail protein [Leptolyngbya sp. SIO4C5]